MTAPDPAQIADDVLSPLEERMATALIFMPEIGHLTAGVMREITSRAVRVAVEFGAHLDGEADV